MPTSTNMEDTIAELVRKIVNGQSEGKELVYNQMIEMGQPPSRMPVLGKQAEGPPQQTSG